MNTIPNRRRGRGLWVGAGTLLLAALLAGCEQPSTPDHSADAAHQTQANATQTDAAQTDAAQAGAAAEESAGPAATEEDTAKEDAAEEGTAKEETAAEAAAETPAAEEEVEVTSCDGTNTVTVSEKLTGRELAESLLAQWKRNNAGRNWVEEERLAHNFNPPADNSKILEGGQAAGQAYGNYTQKDLLTWQRETEKLVAEGSRIFHSGQELGSTVGVSCDMCHPHAANTHPETYPKYQVQLGRVALLRDMINWCIENPARGPRLAPDSAAMRALEAYILAQRSGVKMSYGKH